MSYKLGIILSMVFLVAFFLLGADMISVSNAYSQLDTASITIGYVLAKSGNINDVLLTSLENTYHIEFLSISSMNPAQGEIVDFVIGKDYKPLVLSNTLIKLKTSRSTVIGYYG